MLALAFFSHSTESSILHAQHSHRHPRKLWRLWNAITSALSHHNYSPTFRPPRLQPHHAYPPSDAYRMTLAIAELKPTLAPDSQRPSLAELKARNEYPTLQSPLSLEFINNDIKIERWLGGSTGTASEFKSILGVDDLVKKAGAPVSRLSPIKSIRPSSQRSGSRPDNAVGRVQRFEMVWSQFCWGNSHSE